MPGELDLDGDPSPVKEEAIYANAEKLIHAGQVAEGLAEVDALIAEHPDLADLYYVRGSALSRLDRDDEAYAAFEKSLSLAPKDAKSLTALARLDAWSRGDLQAAAARLKRAVELAPKLVDARLSYALVLHDLRDLEGAESQLGAARMLAPKYADLFHESARVAAARGDLDRAVEMAATAVELAPGEAGLDSRVLLARLTAKQGDPERAALEFERVLRLADAEGAPDHRLAAMRGLVVLGRPESALKPAQELVERYPEKAAVYVALGRVLAALSKLEGEAGALANFEKALSLEANNPAAHRFKAQALAAGGRCAAARKSLKDYERVAGRSLPALASEVDACRRS